MPELIEAADVQQWLDTTKLGVESVDRILEDSAFVYICGYLSEISDTSLWVDAASTPALVLKLVSMLVAAWTYERVYSESTSDQPSWARRLERMVDQVVAAIVAGNVYLPGATPPDTPAFLPNDSTGSSDVYDALGNVVSLAGSEDNKFRMGTRF